MILPLRLDDARNYLLLLQFTLCDTCKLHNRRIAMLKAFFSARPSNPVQGLDIVRVGVALIILMHPLHGFFHYQNIAFFGDYLGSLGYPFGVALAWTVLIIQTLCSLALIVNRLVVPACIGHIVVVIFGLIHFHYPNGWYVVGPGTGGMEWAFILLACLLGVLWAYLPRNKANAAA
jgi:putative oxidoreductase